MNSQIILASASPRRKDLMAQIGYEFKVVVSDVDENIEKCEPAEYVKELSKRKALAVADSLPSISDNLWGDESKSTIDEIIIIGADTVVAVDGEILGKPSDEEDAVRMLMMLSGRCHSVFTGVTIAKKGMSCVESVESVETFSDETKVYMYPITEQEARGYVATGEPMDKAGSYAIQGIASKFVEKIEGSYNNVVGLPVEKIYERLGTGVSAH